MADGNVQPGGDVLNGFVALRNDTHTFGDGLGCDWMITGYHDDLDTGRPAFAHGVGDGGPRGIDHGHETDEGEISDGEVALFGVELVSLGVLFGVEVLVAETEDALSAASQVHVGGLEVLFPLVGQFDDFSLVHDLVTSALKLISNFDFLICLTI